MRHRTARIGAAGIALAAAAFSIGTAAADPQGSPTYRQLAGVGSDTTQDVINAVANNVTISGTKVLGSYNATGSSQITTKDPSTTPGCTINRPNGSGQGRSALLASLQANSGSGNGCLDFSRSSSLNLAPSSPSLTYVPFARDTVSYAVTPDSVVPRTLALSDLRSYYHCDPNFVGSGPNYDVTPILPQSGSGTRSYWETTMNITDADVNNGVYPCIINGTKNGQIIEEHTGAVLDSKSLVPFSIAQYNSQATQLIADRRGRAVLGTVDGTAPVLNNPNFSIRRDVYNVIPSSKTGTSPYSDVFVGPNSKVCQDTADIQKFGFALNPNCGDTSAHS